MTNKEFADMLIECIKAHDTITSDNTTDYGKGYTVAHQHIIELIESQTKAFAGVEMLYNTCWKERRLTDDLHS